MKEPFELVVRNSANGKIVDSHSFQAEQKEGLHEAAKLMSEYMGGLDFELKNQYGQEESFSSISTNTGTFIRSNGGNFPHQYLDLSEKKVYLVALDEDTNDYKYYSMFQEQGNSQFGVSYGRLGGTDMVDPNYDWDKEGKRFFPAKMFYIKYEEKIAKGYIDKSEEMTFQFTRYGRLAGGERIDKDIKKAPKPMELSDFTPIAEEKTRDVIEMLIASQRELVQQNYSMPHGSSDLTTAYNQKAVDSAETLLNKLYGIANDMAEGNGNKVSLKRDFKNTYKELLITLPRNIANVKTYIDRMSTNPESIAETLETERELLDAFKTVYGFDEVVEKKEPARPVQQSTVLEKYGLSAETASFKDKFDVMKRMDNNAHKVSRVLSVENARTKEAYEKCKKDLGIHNGGCHLMWHGSRTENWWSNFKNGMSLNPNAVITGKMFGQGLYFAPLAQKSMGYIDMQGSYWAHGQQPKGYLALFEVAMGKPYEPKHALGSSFTLKDLKYGCHSVWARAGCSSLYHDECIVYRAEQCNMRYLVEVDSARTKPLSFDIDKVQHMKLTKPSFHDGIITCHVPNFKTCTGIPVTKVIANYDIASDALSFSPDKIEHDFGMADRDLLLDVFKSCFAENERDFQKMTDEMMQTGDFPKHIKKQFQQQVER